MASHGLQAAVPGVLGLRVPAPVPLSACASQDLQVSLGSPVPVPRRPPVPVPRGAPVPLPAGAPLPAPPQVPLPAPLPATLPEEDACQTHAPSPPAPQPPAARPARPRLAGRPPSPPPRKSPSESSGSSCSDESCSVCSAKNKKPPPPPKGAKIPPTGSGRPPVRAAPGRAVQPTRELLKAREGTKRTREEKVLEWQRTQTATATIKREGERGGGRGAGAGAGAGAVDPRRPPPVSSATIAAALNDSDTDPSSDASSDPQPQRLTLSERFGKMAQWSADRSSRLENMRITRRESSLHVHIERDRRLDVIYPPGGEPEAPVGSYPETLAAAAPGGLPSWDDVTVRYDYYKQRGYLRGLTLGDYVKWEEWWYKYQEWLERERAYERWADGEPRAGRRDRRRKGGRHRRS